MDQHVERWRVAGEWTLTLPGTPLMIFLAVVLFVILCGVILYIIAYRQGVADTKQNYMDDRYRYPPPPLTKERLEKERADLGGRDPTGW